KANRDFVSLARWSLRKWRNLSGRARNSAKRPKTSLHSVTSYMKHSRLACGRRKLPQQSKNSSCPWCENGKAAAVALKGRTVKADSILQTIFSKQMTKKAEQETDRHIIKITRR